MHYYDPTKVNILTCTTRNKNKSFLFSNISIFWLVFPVLFPFPCQGDDPLGSIHLRGSVVTAVEYVPDGEWDCCHRRHTCCHMLLHHCTKLGQEIISWFLSVVFLQLFPFDPFSLSLPGCSQKIRHWWQPLWDHHLRWDSLLLPSCHSWREKRVDQSSSGSVKNREIRAVKQLWDKVCQPQLNLLIVKFKMSIITHAFNSVSIKYHWNTSII